MPEENFMKSLMNRFVFFVLLCILIIFFIDENVFYEKTENAGYTNLSKKSQIVQKFDPISPFISTSSASIFETKNGVYFPGYESKGQFGNQLSRYLFWLSYARNVKKIFFFGQTFCEEEHHPNGLNNICFNLPTMVYPDQFTPLRPMIPSSVDGLETLNPHGHRIFFWMDLYAVIYHYY